MKIAAITEPPSSDTNRQKPISEYLRFRTILDDEIETQCLARWAKGYLIHDNRMYHHNTLGILQWCIPVKEGKALLLDIHKRIYGHHASSRSMVGKTS
jgi:hypothetical protein